MRAVRKIGGEKQREVSGLRKKAFVINACDSSNYWIPGEEYRDEYCPLLRKGKFSSGKKN